MLIFHDNYKYIDLESYGIQIPFQKNRLNNIFSMEQGGKIYNLDLINADINSVYDESYLRLVHDDQFISKLVGNHTNKEVALSETFELYNSDGTRHIRYKPNENSKPLHTLADDCLRQSFLLLSSCLKSLEKKEDTYVLGGGFHHAMSFGGRGFCLVNDISMAAIYLNKYEKLQNIWIIDVDAHKGDGTAEILQGHPNIHTFSIHMKNGWPLDQGPADAAWFISSDLDIPISSNENHLYLKKLQTGLQTFLDRFGTPDIAIVVQGADPYEYDGLASSNLLKLSKEDMLKRGDQLVFNFFRDLKVKQNYCMSGGYGEKASDIYLNFFSWISKE